MGKLKAETVGDLITQAAAGDCMQLEELEATFGSIGALQAHIEEGERLQADGIAQGYSNPFHQQVMAERIAELKTLKSTWEASQKDWN